MLQTRADTLSRVKAAKVIKIAFVQRYVISCLVQKMQKQDVEQKHIFLYIVSKKKKSPRVIIGWLNQQLEPRCNTLCCFLLMIRVLCRSGQLSEP